MNNGFVFGAILFTLFAGKTTPENEKHYSIFFLPPMHCSFDTTPAPNFVDSIECFPSDMYPEEMPPFECCIFNKNGDTLFQTKRKEDNWLCESDVSRGIPSDAYYYFVTVFDSLKEPTVIRGIIQVVEME